LVATIALTALGVACSAPVLSNAQADTWLEAKAGAPDLDVSGAWESTSSFMGGGWGSAAWVQKGSQVYGALGLYDVRGRIAGQKIFLVLSSRQRVYYTAMLEPTKDGGLLGLAIAEGLADAPGQPEKQRAAIMLVRPRAY
jgi:hypothetical protein